MKLKKLFAGIVAVAMMATMAAPVFAESSAASVTSSVDGNGTLKSTDKIEISKTYTIAQDMTAPEETFSFVLHAESARSGVDKNSKPIANPTPDKTYYIKFTENVSATDTKSFELPLSDLGITKVGVYEYTLTEQSTNATPGITYAPALNMTVSVTNPTDEADTTLNYTVALRDTAGVKVDATKAFENKYTAQKLTISKRVAGNLGDLKEVFAFKVTLKGQTGHTYLDAGIAFNDVTLPEGKTNPDVIPVDGQAHTIYLTHKGSAVIKNLPEGVEYTIEEVASNTVDYTVTLTTDSTANMVADSKTATGTIAKTDAKAGFVNTHTGVVDTGVILDNAPYIALLTIVAAGAVVMIIKKRRNYED